MLVVTGVRMSVVTGVGVLVVTVVAVRGVMSLGLIVDMVFVSWAGVLVPFSLRTAVTLGASFASDASVVAHIATPRPFGVNVPSRLDFGGARAVTRPGPVLSSHHPSTSRPSPQAPGGPGGGAPERPARVPGIRSGRRARLAVGFVVDSPHRELTRRILRFWCDGFQSVWIARHLPALFRECGLLQVYVEPSAIVWDFDFANQMLISGTLEGAVEAGVVTSAEADLWLSHLENARDSGKFFCANMGFLVAGQKE